MSSPIEIRKDGVVVCECKDETCLYPYEIMKDMIACGYKFYQDGKIYKPKKKQEK
jgi:hypothetical protein